MDMPRVELPRTWTERPGPLQALGSLLFVAIVYGMLAITPSATAAWRWGALVCASALALITWVSAERRRITCTEQGITVSTRRSLLARPRQSACRWSDVTATKYSYRPGRLGDRVDPGSPEEDIFAVQTSEGTAVMISDRGSNYYFFFEEFVAICNAHTPQLPYIWEHRQRPPLPHHLRLGGVSMDFGPLRPADEVWQPDYFQVPRDQRGP